MSGQPGTASVNSTANVGRKRPGNQLRPCILRIFFVDAAGSVFELLRNHGSGLQHRRTPAAKAVAAENGIRLVEIVEG